MSFTFENTFISSYTHKGRHKISPSHSTEQPYYEV